MHNLWPTRKNGRSTEEADRFNHQHIFEFISWDMNHNICMLPDSVVASCDCCANTKLVLIPESGMG